MIELRMVLKFIQKESWAICASIKVEISDQLVWDNFSQIALIFASVNARDMIVVCVGLGDDIGVFETENRQWSEISEIKNTFNRRVIKLISENIVNTRWRIISKSS